MKSKLKLEMKESLFIVSVLIYIASLLLLMGLGPGVFTGTWFVGVFVNSQAFSVVSTLIIGVIMILFTYLARKVSINFIYVVRGILLLLTISNALFIGWKPISCSIYFVATVALLVMTYIKDNEYVIVTDLTQEELANIEKENKRERKHEIVGSLLGYFFVPIIVLVLLVGASPPVVEKNYEDLKNSYRVNLPTEMATEEQCNEFLENINNYEELWGPWYLDTVNITKMLKSDTDSDDYWMIGNNVDIVYHLFYDDWDDVADEYTLIRKDYKFPDVKIAKVSQIYFAANFSNGYNKEKAVVIDLTEKEIEEIRHFIMEPNYDEGKTQYYDKEYFEHERKLDILWYFEGEDALYYECGEIIKTADGKYHLRASPSYYTVYTLPDEICEKLDAVWQ